MSKKTLRGASYQFERLSTSNASTNAFSLPQYASSPIKTSNSSSFRSRFSSQNLSEDLKLFFYDNSPYPNISLGEAHEDKQAFIEDSPSDDGINIKKRTYWFGLIFLITVVVMYIASSTASVALIKYLNYEGRFFFPVFTAILHKCLWPLHLIIYVVYNLKTKSLRFPSMVDIGKYAILGFLSATIDVFGMYGLNGLQGSTYVLLRSGDLVFSVFLAQFILKKRFTILHYVAVALILIAVVVNSVSAIMQEELIPIICTLVGCLFESVNTVISDKFLKARKNPKRVSGYSMSTESTFFVNIFAFAFLVIPLMATHEYTGYVVAIDSLKDLNLVGPTYGHFSLWVFVLVLLGIAFSRFAVRLTKYWIIEKRSTFTFSVLKPVRRVLSALFLILLFSEGYTWMKLLGMALTILGFGLYLAASKRVTLQQEILKSDVVQRQPSPADT